MDNLKILRGLAVLLGTVGMVSAFLADNSLATVWALGYTINSFALIRD